MMGSRIILKIFLFAIIIFSCNSKSGKRLSVKTDEYFQVSKVVDGDTFWVTSPERGEIKIRLIGVDAPESRNVFKKKKGYYGPEAKEYLMNLIQDKSIQLISDVDSLDQYGRTLSYAYLEDGTFINAELVENGYAMVMTIPPNVKYADSFLQLQIEARENNRGLWKE